MAWSTPKTWVDNVDVLSATNLNTHVRDQFNALHTWASYTPTWTATGGTPTVGNGTLSGSYIAYGDVCTFQMSLVLGSTTSLGTTTAWAFSLPVTASGANDVFAAYVHDAWTGIYPAVGIGSSTTVQLRAASGGTVGYNTPFTWVSGDGLAISGTYRT